MAVLHPILIKPLCKKSIVKLPKAQSNLNIDELLHLTDRSFSSNEKCNGCGICSKVCPVSNIRITDNKPVWRNHCETCLACHNWCPNKAIQGGVGANDYYYHHPEIKVSEINSKLFIYNPPLN